MSPLSATWAQSDKKTMDLIRQALADSNVERQGAALLLIPELGLQGPAAAATALQLEEYLQSTIDPENKALALTA